MNGFQWRAELRRCCYARLRWRLLERKIQMFETRLAASEEKRGVSAVAPSVAQAKPLGWEARNRTRPGRLRSEQNTAPLKLLWWFGKEGNW